MSDQHPTSSSDHGDPQRQDHRPPGMPRWVKGFLIVVLVLILAFLVLQVVSPGQHGPRRHGGLGPLSAGTSGSAPVIMSSMLQ